MANQVDPNITYRTLCLRRLDKHINNAALKQMCGIYGELSKYQVMRDECGNSKGYAFVMFEKSECAEMAVDELPNATLFPTPENLSAVNNIQDLVQSERVNRIGGNLHVANLDFAMTNRQLRELFQKYGRVMSVKITKHSGNVRNGFVQFSNYDEAVTAKRALDGQKIGSRELFISFAKNQVDQEAALGLKYFENMFEEGNIANETKVESPIAEYVEATPFTIPQQSIQPCQSGLTVSIDTFGGRSVMMLEEPDMDDYLPLQRAFIIDDPILWCGD